MSHGIANLQVRSAVMTATSEFGAFRLHCLIDDLSAEWREKIIAFWTEHRALPAGDDGDRRVSEVVFIATTADDTEIVAVNTVFPGKLTAEGPDHHVYRMFIRPQDRESGLAHHMTTQTRELLTSRYDPDSGPAGFVVVTENPKLVNDGVAELFRAAGYLLHGQDGRGSDIWVYYFDRDAAT